MDDELTALGNIGAGGAGIELLLQEFSGDGWIELLSLGDSMEQLLILLLGIAAIVAVFQSVKWISG